MYLRREGEEFWKYFVDNYGYHPDVAATLRAGFVTQDGLFDVRKWWKFVDEIKATRKNK